MTLDGNVSKRECRDKYQQWPITRRMTPDVMYRPWSWVLDELVPSNIPPTGRHAPELIPKDKERQDEMKVWRQYYKWARWTETKELHTTIQCQVSYYDIPGQSTIWPRLFNGHNVYLQTGFCSSNMPGSHRKYCQYTTKFHQDKSLRLSWQISKNWILQDPNKGIAPDRYDVQT